MSKNSKGIVASWFDGLVAIVLSMKRFLIVLWPMTFCCLAQGAEPPKKGGVKFPGPPPAPMPSPAGPLQLGKGQIMAVSDTAGFLLLDSRQGFVKLTKLKTPCVVYGDWVDPQPGDDDGRSFTALQTVWLVKAIATGDVELIAVSDLSGNALVNRQLVTCNLGPSPPPPLPPAPPVPVDPFLVALQAAYSADVDADKATSVVALANIYRATAALTGSMAFVNNSDIVAYIKDLEAAQPLAPAAIPNVRKAIGSELNSLLPVVDARLTKDARDLYAKQYGRMASLLDAIAKGGK
jgi:hypothetical protein